MTKKWRQHEDLSDTFRHTWRDMNGPRGMRPPSATHASATATHLLLVVDQCPQPRRAGVTPNSHRNLVAHGAVVRALEDTVDLRVGVRDLVLLALAWAVTCDTDKDALVLRSRAEANG